LLSFAPQPLNEKGWHSPAVWLNQYLLKAARQLPTAFGWLHFSSHLTSSPAVLCAGKGLKIEKLLRVSLEK
jgi:hypothetical protein